jgi:hypothetical protein
MQRPAARGTPWTLALLAGALGTWRYHLPELLSRLDRFFADRGDPRFITFVCEHWYRALTGRAELLSPPFFHPAEKTLGYSDVLLGYALPYSLLRALGLEMFTAMQAVVIAFDFLAFVFCFALLFRVLRLHPFAAGAAAMFFAFASPKHAQLHHLQMQLTALLPLLAICLLAFARSALAGARARSLVLLALAVLCFHAQLLTTFYYGWFLALWGVLLVAIALVLPTTRALLATLVRRSWPVLAAGAALLLVGAIPFVIVYLPTTRAASGYSYEQVLPLLPSPHDFLQMGPRNSVWSSISAALRGSPPAAFPGELRLGIGLVPTLAWIAAAAFALRAALRGARPAARCAGAGGRSDGGGVPPFLIAAILATVLFLLLALKIGGDASAWRFVYAFFPGAGAVRAVARGVLFLALPMAIAFAHGIDAALGWARTRRSRAAARASAAGVVLLAGFAIYEQLGVELGFSKAVERAYLDHLSRSLPVDCDAFYLAAPAGGTSSVAEYQYDAMMVSLSTGVPTLNGLSSQLPAGWGLLPIDAPDYEERVRAWIRRERIAGEICRLEVDLPVEAFATESPHPIDQPLFFVRQHYLDLMDREPTAEELERWVGILERLPASESRRGRVLVSQAIFR